MGDINTAKSPEPFLTYPDLRAFIDSFDGNPKATMIGVGDIDGDGLVDVVRPTENPPLHLRAATLIAANFTAVGCDYRTPDCYKAIPDVTQSLRDVSVLDLDGDGTAEIIRNQVPCPNWTCNAGAAGVTSPTFNSTISMPPATVTSSQGNTPARWFLDLNGDGRPDVAWLFDDGTGYYKLFTEFGTGYGFGGYGSAGTINLGNVSPAWLLPLVVDANLDGREDLLLMTYGSTTSKLILSDGNGYAAGVAGSVNVPTAYFDGTGPRADRVVADLNGDGLPDILQLEGVAPSIHVVGYLHGGKAPEMVTGITEGTGRQIAFSYDVSSSKDSSFYSANPTQTCQKDPQFLSCVNRGRWLVRSLSVGGADVPTLTQTFKYTGGVSDKNGWGFLGFTQREIFGPDSRHTTITYDVLTHQPASHGYVYPYLGLPEIVKNEAETGQGTHPRHTDTQTNYFQFTLQSDGTYVAPMREVARYLYDCSSNGFDCNAPLRELGSQDETFQVDSYGNTTNHVRTYVDASGTVLETDTDSTTFTYNTTDINNWLISQPDPANPSTQTSQVPSSGETVTRTVKLTPDSAHGGLASIEIEPNGDPTTHLLRSFGRDPQGRLQTITDQEFSANLTRTTTFSYEDADGVYVGTTTFPMPGHFIRTWRHPGFGFVVEQDDPNGLAATRQYDVFGRVLSEKDYSGASTTITYLDNNAAAVGADLEVFPEGKATRMVRVHLDSYGRETSSVSPIDGARAVGHSRQFDALGRLANESILSGPTPTPTTVLNTYYYYYDDLDRFDGVSHFASDGTLQSTSKVHDGLTLTDTDESGRQVTHVSDAMGRPSVQRAAAADGSLTDATFTYGPFGVLEHEGVSDKSGQTDIGYDVLGRVSSTTRPNAGTRGTTYNAFGDIVTTFKQPSPNSQVDTLTYGRDALGRLTSITGPTITSRYFFWDTNTGGPEFPAPDNAIGKLVDVLYGATDIYSAQSGMHLMYDANGKPNAKWYFSTIPGGGPSPVGIFNFSYDSQGRISTLTYPTNFFEATPMTIAYGYDDYTGEANSIIDTSFTNTAIWTAGARNDRGQLVDEFMQYGGPQVVRSTNYYLPDGRRANTMLGGLAQEIYTYQADGLPNTFAVNNFSQSWTSTFNYDNLGRLTTWQPDTSGPAVTYGYDGDGNLNQRSWFGETVSYANGTNGRTVTVVGAFTTARSDLYQIDSWGRIFDTPAVGLTYDGDDRVTGVSEKTTGLWKNVYLDGFGREIGTNYGNPFDGHPFGFQFALDDLYEMSYSSANGRTERYRLHANGKLVGDILRNNANPPTSATFYMTDNVGDVIAEISQGIGVPPPPLPLPLRAQRDPFGNLVSDVRFPNLPTDPSGTDPDGSDPIGFGGHPREASWGLVNMISRYYSPALGRFATPDPIISNAFDRRQYNPFAYVTNTPTAYTDPLGLCGEPEGEPCPQDGSGGGDWEGTKHAFWWTVHKVEAGGKWVGHEAKAGGEWVGHEAASLWHSLWSSNSTPPAPPVSGPPAQASATSASAAQTSNVSLAAPEPAGGNSLLATESEAPEHESLVPEVTHGLGTGFGTLAEKTPVTVSSPPTLGPYGNPTGTQFNVTTPEVTEGESEFNPMIKNAVQGMKGAMAIKALQLIEGIDQALGGTILPALSWLNAMTTGNQLSWWEGAFMAAAARSPIPWMKAAAVGYGLFKIILHEQKEGADMSARGFPTNPNLDGM
jgi:RHS repeat-associated protein